MFIGMIWRPTPDRLRSFRQAQEFWSLMGDVQVFDSGHPVFNRAASRNMAVRAAYEQGYRKLVVTDADCIPEPKPLLEAFAQVDDTAVHLPYTHCQVLNRTGRVVADIGFTCGGTYVTTVDGWNSVGGQDERFVKWAPEDMAFMLAHQTLVGPMVKHDGVLLSLAHDADPHRVTALDSDPLVQLYRDYEAANGDPLRMRQLCFPS